MESIADIYEKAKNFITLQGTQPGELNLKESRKLNKQRRKQERQEDLYGMYTYENPVKTRYGMMADTDAMNTAMGLARSERDTSLAAQYTPQLPAHPLVQPEILGIQSQQLAPNYEQLPQIKGRKPVQEIVPDEDSVERFVKNAKKYASRVSPDPRLTYRQKNTVKENAEYVGQYIEAVMRLAPYFNLPPKTIAAMLMKESGWGGQRFDGNLGGYGFLDSGEDMGIRFKASTIEEQAAKYLEKVATDWGGRYQGSRTPEEFHKRGYNPHKEYAGGVMDVYRMLDAK